MPCGFTTNWSLSLDKPLVTSQMKSSWPMSKRIVVGSPVLSLQPNSLHSMLQWQRYHDHTILAHLSIRILTYPYLSQFGAPMRLREQRKVSECRFVMIQLRNQPRPMMAERSHPFTRKYCAKWLRCCGKTKIGERIQEQIRQPPGRVPHWVVKVLHMLWLWQETQQMLS